MKLPTSILSSEISSSAKIVYAYLLDRQGRDGGCWPSIRAIAKDCHTGKNAVQRAVSELILAGLLTRNSGAFPNANNSYRVSPRNGDYVVPETGTIANARIVPETGTGSPRNGDRGVPETGTMQSPKRGHLKIDNKTYTQRRAFQKPILEDISEYILSEKFHIDPEAWLAYYESNGWRVGKNPMKDWKAAVRTWERKWREQHPPPASRVATAEDLANYNPHGMVDQ